MKTFDIALVRLLQLLVLLFLIIAATLWYGCALLIPFTVWLGMTGIFSMVLTPAIAALISLLITGALSVHLTRVPKLLETFLSTGVELIKLGDKSIQRLSEIALAIRHKSPLQPHKVEIVLKS